MSFIGDPSYRYIYPVNTRLIAKVSPEFIINSFMALRVSFKFPKDIKYPCIPVQVDPQTTLYPLQGESTITGLEYVLARKMGCELTVTSGFAVPFSNLDMFNKELKQRPGYPGVFSKMTVFERVKEIAQVKGRHPKPFQAVVADLIAKRALETKGSFAEQMFKIIVNSIYGLTGMGLSGKSKFDTKTGGTLPISGGELTNPLVCGYITAFTRCVISECMENIYKMGGVVVSATTDGFITDIEDLESKLLELPEEDTLLFRIHAYQRGLLLKGDKERGLNYKEQAQVLELKHKEIESKEVFEEGEENEKKASLIS